MGEFSFPKKFRVRKSKEYEAVFQRGRKVKAWPFLAFILANGLAYTRLGMAVSKKAGKAPRRNRIKRLFREAFRLTRPELAAGYDLVLIPLDRNHEYKLHEIEACLARLLRPPESPAPQARVP